MAIQVTKVHEPLKSSLEIRNIYSKQIKNQNSQVGEDYKAENTACTDPEGRVHYAGQSWRENIKCNVKCKCKCESNGESK